MGLDYYENYQHRFNDAVIKCIKECHQFTGEAVETMINEGIDIKTLQSFMKRLNITIKKVRLENHAKDSEDYEVNFNGKIKTFSIASRFSEIKDEMIKGDKQ